MFYTERKDCKECPRFGHRRIYMLRFFSPEYVIIRNNPRARPSHSAHLSITGQLKWSWGLPLFEIKALLGFRSAGGIPTLVAFSSLIRTLRITGVSVITICGVPSIIRSLSWTATGPRCTWAGGLSWIHVTWNIDLQRHIIQYSFTYLVSFIHKARTTLPTKDTFSILFVETMAQLRGQFGHSIIMFPIKSNV